MPKFLCLFLLSILVLTQPTFAQAPPVIRLGRGPAETLAWSSTGERLAVAGSSGIWLYDDDLNDIASVELALSRPRLTWVPDRDLLAVESTRSETPFTVVYDVSADSFRPLLDVAVETVNWTPDGELMFVRMDRGITTLETDTLAEVTQVSGACSVAFSENGRYTALVRSSQIEIWDNSSRTRLVVLPDTEGNLNRAWFSPDGTLLAGASDDRIVIWNVATGEQINSIVSERDDDWLQERPVSRIREKVSEVLWESDSDALIVVNGYRELTTLRVWQLTGATPLIKYPLAGLREPRIAWTSDASKLIFRGYGGSGYPSTITFDAATWQEVPNNFQDGNWRFSPDRSLILSATFRSDIVTLLNANDLSIVREFHTHANRPNDLAWHPDGIRFASTHGDEVQVWDVSRGTLVARNTAHIANMFKENLVWSPDSRYVAFSNSVFGGRFTYNQSTLHVWDVNNAVPRLAISEHVPFVGSAAWNTTGELLLTSDTTHVTLWDGQSGHWVQELPNDYDSFVRMAAWSSDGQTIAVLQYAATQATVNLYDVTTGEIVRQISTPDATRIIWRPNSATFVTVEKESWSLWDAQTGEKVSMIPNRVFSVYWSPDGSQLATTGEHLTLWQVSSDGQALTKLGPFDIDASFDPLSWRPDGSQIAVGIGSEIQIMDVDTGMVVETMALSGEGTVSELAWSPDGMHLAWFTSDTPYLYIEDVVDD